MDWRGRVGLALRFHAFSHMLGAAHVACVPVRCGQLSMKNGDAYPRESTMRHSQWHSLHPSLTHTSFNCIRLQTTLSSSPRHGDFTVLHFGLDVVQHTVLLWVFLSKMCASTRPPPLFRHSAYTNANAHARDRACPYPRCASNRVLGGVLLLFPPHLHSHSPTRSQSGTRLFYRRFRLHLQHPSPRYLACTAVWSLLKSLL